MIEQLLIPWGTLQVELSKIDVHNSRYTRHVHELQSTSLRIRLTLKTSVFRSWRER